MKMTLLSGRSPKVLFYIALGALLSPLLKINSDFYRSSYADLVGLTPRNLRAHWLQHGRLEGRIRSWNALVATFGEAGIAPSTFQPQTFLAQNPLLAHMGMLPPAAAIHFLSLARAGKATREFCLPAYLAAVDSAGHRDSVWNAVRAISVNDRVPQWDRAASELFTDQHENFLLTLDLESFIIASFLQYRGHTPEIRVLDSLCTQFDFGLRSRMGLLMDLIRGSAWELDEGNNPTPVRTELEGSVNDYIAHGAEERASEYLSLMGVTGISRGLWFEAAFAESDEGSTDGSHDQRIASRADFSDGQQSSGAVREVSVLCSLYRTDEHLLRFLSNIIDQSHFSQTEFVFVLVSPSDFELKTCTAYAQKFSNILLDIVPNRIGIYEAWNKAVALSSAPFITNMNVDDFRRSDSLEKQAQTLLEFPWVDVTYQDVVLTLDSQLSWSSLERINSVISLPSTSLNTFFSYMNPPHNAPMWRRTLHSEIGYFDERLLSAGDFDFWFRCARAGKVFFGTNDAHVAYYENPQGLSTSQDSAGLIEGREVLTRNADLLLSSTPQGFLNPHPEIPIDIPLSRSQRLTLGLIYELEQLDSGVTN
jgi:hypothetical protein